MNLKNKPIQRAIARLLALILTATLIVSGAPTALAAGGLTDFEETDSVHVDKAAGTVTVGNTHGDHFAVYEGQEQKANDFVLEADVDLVSGGYDGNKESRCAGLIFGVSWTIPLFCQGRLGK